MLEGVFIFYYFFGVILYDAMPGALQFIDEVFPWLLFALLLYEHRGKLPVSFLPLFGVFLFYLLYSIIIRSNTLPSILYDFVVQIKSFLAFYAFLYLGPRFSPRQKSIIRISMLCGAAIIFLVGLFRIGKEFDTIPGEILTGARYSFAALYTGLTYLVFSERTSRDIAVSLLVMFIGFCVPTSKFLGAIIFFVFLYFLTSKRFSKIRIPVIISGAVLSVPLVLSILDDFFLYFTSEDAARAALYITAGRILLDYVPFGSGFASFATTASAKSYSKLYEKYDISNIFGLSESDVDVGSSFISDAYLSSLSQFGFVGIGILVIFFVFIYRKAKRNCSDRSDVLIVLFVLIDMVIENIADSTLIGNRGVFTMMLLASLVVKPSGPSAAEISEGKDETA